MARYRALIAPFVAVIAIMLQLVFGLEISEEILSEFVTSLANLIAVGVVVYSIFKNHFEQEKQKRTQE